MALFPVPRGHLPAPRLPAMSSVQGREEQFPRASRPAYGFTPFHQKDSLGLFLEVSLLWLTQLFSVSSHSSHRAVPDAGAGRGIRGPGKVWDGVPADSRRAGIQREPRL